MTKQIVISDSYQITQPPLHDARAKGLVLTNDGKLLMPVETIHRTTPCLIFHGVERLRIDDFREGNTILDVTVSSGPAIDVEDVCYAYGLEATGSEFLEQTMERLTREQWIVARLNPSYGCTLVCICRKIETEDDLLTALGKYPT